MGLRKPQNCQHFAFCNIFNFFPRLSLMENFENVENYGKFENIDEVF